MKSMGKWTAILIGVVLLTGFAVAATAGALKVGDAVFAEWTVNGWYHGKIDKTCSGGWHIAFDDGDQKCCTAGQIVPDMVPDKSKVKVGSSVLAEWTNAKYYPGKVSAISGSNYSIQFNDGDKGTVTIGKIRLR